MNLDLISTIKDSDVEEFYSKYWDLERLKNCIRPVEEATERQEWWDKDFEVVPCETSIEFYAMLGFEMAMEIKKAKEGGYKLAFILPVGPDIQYYYCAYYIRQMKIHCDHVYGFNMDDYTDSKGDPCNIFGPVMEAEFYNLLGEYTVPKENRNYATSENLPTYPEKLRRIREEGGRVVCVEGIGMSLHVAFWDVQYAERCKSDEEWLDLKYLVAADLHPIAIEQNCLVAFKGDYTKIPPRANTVGMGLMLESDYIIGGCSADYRPGREQWQSVGIWAALRYGPDRHITCSWLPTRPGKFYFISHVAGADPTYADRN